MKIGFAGQPPDDVLAAYAGRSVSFIDLDEPISGIPISLAEEYLPKVYCAVLRTILANAISLELDLVIASVGKCKCDGMRYISRILKDILQCPVIETENLSTDRRGNPISTSNLALKKKMQLIVSGIIKMHESLPLMQSKALMGFWGVPPHDFGLLELFPDNTHIYGWSRCLENRTPADLDLELLVDELPIVFFSQSFCQKNSLAEYMAKKHNGLYMEVDENITHSAKAKLEAFIEFRVKQHVIA